MLIQTKIACKLTAVHPMLYDTVLQKNDIPIGSLTSSTLHLECRKSLGCICVILSLDWRLPTRVMYS